MTAATRRSHAGALVCPRRVWPFRPARGWRSSAGQRCLHPAGCLTQASLRLQPWRCGPLGRRASSNADCLPSGRIVCARRPRVPQQPCWGLQTTDFAHVDRAAMLLQPANHHKPSPEWLGSPGRGRCARRLSLTGRAAAARHWRQGARSGSFPAFARVAFHLRVSHRLFGDARTSRAAVRARKYVGAAVCRRWRGGGHPGQRARQRAHAGGCARRVAAPLSAAAAAACRCCRCCLPPLPPTAAPRNFFIPL